MPSAHGARVAELLDAYLRHSAATGLHCEESRELREQVFDLFKAAVGDMPVADLRTYHLTDFVESQAGWKSISTKRSRSDCIRAAFNWALREERIARHPFINVRYAENERRPDMPDDVLARITGLAAKPVEYALRFLRLTAARVSELCRADWHDVDFEQAIWTINKDKGRRYRKRVKIVALVPAAIDLLKMLMSQRLVVDGPIFLNSRGRRWTRRTLGQNLSRLKARHKIETKASLHGIRHRASTAAIARGAPIKLVSQQLGHASVAITERYYYQPGKEHIAAMREAFQKGLE